MSYRERDSRDRFDSRPPLPSRSQMGGRIYVGRLPPDIREREIEKEFDRFGKVQEISLKGNYCFLQYRSGDEAKEAVYEMNEAKVFGERILVEHARTPKEFSQRGGFGGGGRSSYGGPGRRDYGFSRPSRDTRLRSPPRRSDYRISVTNLSTRCSWQDLKAVMEKAGEVVFSDAHKRRVGEGVVEFASKKDMERALKKLNGLEINGKPIKLAVEEIGKRRRDTRSRSGSRSHSRSRSDSRSRSRSRSSSPERKRRRSGRSERSESRSSAEGRDHSDDDKEKSRDDGTEKGETRKVGNKSDEDEFDEAERKIQQKKERSGHRSGSESHGEEENGPEGDAEEGEAEAEQAEENPSGSASPEVKGDGSEDIELQKSGGEEEEEEEECADGGEEDTEEADEQNGEEEERVEEQEEN